MFQADSRLQVLSAGEPMKDVQQLEAAFAYAQQVLIDRFKLKMRDAAESVLDSIYIDVTNHAVTDAHVNYHNHLRNEFRQSLMTEIVSECGQYSWAHQIRMEMLRKHPYDLQTTIIKDLLERVRSLEKQIEDNRRFRWTS